MADLGLDTEAGEPLEKSCSSRPCSLQQDLEDMGTMFGGVSGLRNTQINIQKETLYAVCMYLLPVRKCLYVSASRELGYVSNLKAVFCVCLSCCAGRNIQP